MTQKYNATAKEKIAGIYQSSGESIYRGLNKIKGNGPNKLYYQKAQNAMPGYFWGKMSNESIYKVYAFTTIKNFEFDLGEDEPTNVYNRLNPEGAEALKRWAIREGANADKIRDEQIAHGKVVHRCAENIANNKPLGLYPLSSTPYVDALKNDILPYLHQPNSNDFILGEDGTSFPLSELFVADFSLGVATRFDRIARLNFPESNYNGYPAMLELKTSGKVKSIDYMKDHIVQAVAGMTLFNTVANICSSLKPLEGIILAYCYGNGSGEIIPIFGEENIKPYLLIWEQYFDEFAMLLESAILVA